MSVWSQVGLYFLCCLPHTLPPEHPLFLFFQPNDAGANKAFKRFQDKSATITVLWLAAMSRALTLPQWNQSFVDAWETYVKEQHGSLFSGTNNITDGWKNVGLLDGRIVDFPYWQMAIHTLGRYARQAEIESSGLGGEVSAKIPSSFSSQPRPSPEEGNVRAYVCTQRARVEALFSLNTGAFLKHRPVSQLFADFVASLPPWEVNKFGFGFLDLYPSSS
jgi:hypothetical protein